MLTYACPAACGEVVEGYVGDQHFLTSYTVDCYNQVSVISKPCPQSYLTHHPKACQALDLLAAAHPQAQGWRQKLGLISQGQIPRGKGMGSSTADVGLAIRAASDAYGLDLSPDDLVRYGVGVEATDTSLYSRTTLMNGQTGRLYGQYDFNFDFSVLVLAPKQGVQTNFQLAKLKAEAQGPKKSLYLTLFTEVIQAYQAKDLAWLADLAWRSAQANQALLTKPLLYDLYGLTSSEGVLGLNIAHTGTVVCLWFDPKRIKLTDLVRQLKTIDPRPYYTRARVFQTCPPGVFHEGGS